MRCEVVAIGSELLLGQIVEFWMWTVECSIVEGVRIAPEEATSPHPVGADKALVQRYEAARAAERSTG